MPFFLKYHCSIHKIVKVITLKFNIVYCIINKLEKENKNKKNHEKKKRKEKKNPKTH